MRLHKHQLCEKYLVYDSFLYCIALDCWLADTRANTSTIKCRRKFNCAIRFIHNKNSYVGICLFLCFVLLFSTFTIVISVTTYTESRVTGYGIRESSSSVPWRAAMAPVTFRGISPLTAGKRRFLCNVHT